MKFSRCYFILIILSQTMISCLSTKDNSNEPSLMSLISGHSEAKIEDNKLEADGYISLRQKPETSDAEDISGLRIGSTDTKAKELSNNSEPRSAGMLPEKECGELLNLVDTYFKSNNMDLMIKNINVGFVFMSKNSSNNSYVFVAPSSSFMLSSSKIKEVKKIKCIEEGEYFDVVTNIEDIFK